jgi:hypothetical protein
MNIFQNSTKTLSKQGDPQIVRVPMTQNDVGGRTDHIPSPSRSEKMSIEHVKSK